MLAMKISLTIKRLKVGLLYVIQQEFHNNQANNNDREQVDEKSCGWNARND